MVNKGYLALILAIAIVITIVAIVGQKSPLTSGGRKSSSLLVVVTIPGFEEDIKKLLCSDDKVLVLVPPGVDPHNYQLTPKDVKLLTKASIIISSAHTYFENQIRRLVESGDIKAKLVEIPRIAVYIAVNPDTGQKNYHAMIYDPRNLLKLLEVVRDEASRLRPACAKQYIKHFEELRESIEKLLRYSGRVDVDAIGEAPGVQYAVEWLGVHVVLLVQPEHGAQPSPGIVDKAVRLIREGRVKAVIVFENSTSPAARFLKDLALSNHLAVIEVPPPLKPGSLIWKLNMLVTEVFKIVGGRNAYS